MDRKIAVKAKKKALESIRMLHSILDEDNLWNEAQSFELKKGIGLAIGSIEVDLLSRVYAAYPDLNDIDS